MVIISGSNLASKPELLFKSDIANADKQDVASYFIVLSDLLDAAGIIP
jgi:hypothetical protein